MSNSKELYQVNSREEELELCSIPRWQQYKATLNNLSCQEFIAQAQKNESAQLLDVRTVEEFETGTIEGAINFNYLSYTLADDIGTLDKNSDYYIFCRTGRRSLRVCMLLKNSGFNVYNLDGGIVNQEIDLL